MGHIPGWGNILMQWHAILSPRSLFFGVTRLQTIFTFPKCDEEDYRGRRGYWIRPRPTSKRDSR